VEIGKRYWNPTQLPSQKLILEIITAKNGDQKMQKNLSMTLATASAGVLIPQRRDSRIFGSGGEGWLSNLVSSKMRETRINIGYSPVYPLSALSTYSAVWAQFQG
jgi:hypothetical protein